MSTDTIEKGSKVSVTLTGDYSSKALSGHHYVKAPDGGTYLLPKDADVFVVDKPLPKEPPLATLVQVGSATIYKRSTSGWWRITGNPETTPGGGVQYATWAELNDRFGRGEVHRVVKDKTDSAADIKEKPFEVKSPNWSTPMRVVAFNGGYDVRFTAPCGDKLEVSDFVARDLAFAILKATGGR